MTGITMPDIERFGMKKLNVTNPKTVGDLSAAIFRRNVQAFLKKKIGKDFENRKPQLGIFWVEIGKAGVVDFAALKAPYDQGVDMGDFLVYDGDHYSIWEEIQKQYPQWKRKKYNEVPRGRISFNKKKMEFVVVMPGVYVKNKELVGEVLKYYAIPRELAEVVTDKHY
jgi:hypothetical protein